MKTNPQSDFSKKLSPEQKQLISAHKFQGSKTVAEWLTFLQRISVNNHQIKDRRSLVGWVGGLSIPAGIIAFFTFPPLIILLVLIGILSFYFYNRMSKAKIGETLGEFIIPMFTSLMGDIKPNSLVNLSFDYTATTSKDKRVENPPPTWKSGGSTWMRGNEYKYFLTKWMQSKMKFRDGVVVNWGIDLLVRSRTRTKRSSSGKMKTKTKYKTKMILVLKVNVPKARYSINPNLGPNFQPDATDTHFIFKVRRKAILNFGSKNIKVGSLLKEIAKVYKCLTPIK